MKKIITLKDATGHIKPVAIEIWEDGSGMDKLISVIELADTASIELSDNKYIIVRQL